MVLSRDRARWGCAQRIGFPNEFLDEPGARWNESQLFWDMLGKTSTTDDRTTEVGGLRFVLGRPARPRRACHGP